MKKTQSKTAQMEIMGLAIVVILLLVGLMFAIRFIVNKNPTNFRKGFIDSELASNMINTFLDTNSKDCRKLTMKELLQDCSKGYPGIISCNNEGSPLEACYYVQQEAEAIFSKTLEKWNVKYNLLAFTDNPSNPMVEAGTKCQGEKRSETFLVPSAVTINVKLDIC